MGAPPIADMGLGVEADLSRIGLLLVALAVALSVLALWRRPGKALGGAGREGEAQHRVEAGEALLPATASYLPASTGPGGTPTVPHLQGIMMNDGTFLYSNQEEAVPFENEFCSGRLLPLHRATYDKELNKSGNYKYGKVFEGRSINWEFRLQFRFKEAPETPVVMGIELDAYVPVHPSAKRFMEMTTAAIRWCVGGELYHSVGDDPQQVEGELEKPVFAMPLWAFDQIIETPEGEEPPDIHDVELYSKGLRRAVERQAFLQKAKSLRLRPGPTYTFSFCSISRFLDNIQWKICGVVPGMTLDFDSFCGRPPVHIVVYSLKEEPDGSESRETRHLQSRKNYYFHMAFWSSMRQISPEQLEDLQAQVVCPKPDVHLRARAALLGEPAQGNSRPKVEPKQEERRIVRALRGLTGCLAGLGALSRLRRRGDPSGARPWAAEAAACWGLA